MDVLNISDDTWFSIQHKSKFCHFRDKDNGKGTKEKLSGFANGKEMLNAGCKIKYMLYNISKFLNVKIQLLTFIIYNKRSPLMIYLLTCTTERNAHIVPFKGTLWL